MKTLRARVLVGLVGLVMFVGLAGVALAADIEGAAEVTGEQLVYQSAEVKTQIDVNGEAAVQLIGSGLDAAVAQIQEQAKAMQASGGKPEGPMAMLPTAMPVVAQAKDAIKSLTRVTVLVMRPKSPVDAGQFLKYYSGLMMPSGWSQLMTVRDEGNTTVCAMLGPEGKGLFFAVNDKHELVVALITTSKPLGDLIGQIVNASGGSLPAILKLASRGSFTQARRGPSPPPKPAATAKPRPKGK